MYERFFNLKEKPFNLTPSSRFLYLGEAHKEALALLRYGVAERKGFILLTGEVGTGKTTIAHAFLGELDKRVHCIYLSNPLLTPQDLYNYLASSAFKKRVICRSKASFILYFEAFLRARLKNQEIVILVIDEAQRLSYELLEEIRLLSNIETAEEKLINIFLIGQPELNEKLNDPRCRPLLQRISIRHHIKPLSLEETIEYLSTRLRVAGAEDMEELFSRKVAEAIYEYSQGYPRVINNLADNVLLLSFSKNERNIRPEVVKRCYDDMMLEGSFLYTASSKTADSVIPEQANRRSLANQRRSRTGTQKQVKPGMTKWMRLVSLCRGRVRDREESSKNQKPVGIERRSVKKATFLILFLALGFLGFLGGVEISNQGQAFMSRIETYFQPNAQAWIVSQAKEKTTEGARVEELSVNTVGEQNETLPDDVQEPEPDAGHKETVVWNSTVEIPEEETPAVNADKARLGQGEKSPDAIVVRAGDTLFSLALKHYGRADGTILELLVEKNPGLKSVNLIEIGQRIHFPPILASSEAVR